MTKKHTLRPGKHQFAPGSAPVHDNDNLSDEEAEWYIKKYPHIVALFIPQLFNGRDQINDINEDTAYDIVNEQSINYLTPPSEDKGGI